MARPEQEFLWQCQKQAALWLYQLRRNKTSDWHIRRNLAALPEPEREETRKWLNHYREQQKPKRKPTNAPKRRSHRRSSAAYRR